MGNSLGQKYDKERTNHNSPHACHKIKTVGNTCTLPDALHCRSHIYAAAIPEISQQYQILGLESLIFEPEKGIVLTIFYDLHSAPVGSVQPVLHLHLKTLGTAVGTPDQIVIPVCDQYIDISCCTDFFKSNRSLIAGLTLFPADQLHTLKSAVKLLLLMKHIIFCQEGGVKKQT